MVSVYPVNSIFVNVLAAKIMKMSSLMQDSYHQFHLK